MARDKLQVRYREFLNDLDAIARGDVPGTLEKTVDKAWIIHDTQPTFVPDTSGVSEYAQRASFHLTQLAELRSQRRKCRVNDAEAEMSSEVDAFDELSQVTTIFGDLIFPSHVGERQPSQFMQTMLREIYHLSLAYAHSVTQACAEEFVDGPEIYEAKVNSTAVPREAFDFTSAFIMDQKCQRGNETYGCFRRFNDALQRATSRYLRDFKLTLVTPKNISRKEESIEAVVEQATNETRPDFIVPIAQGGVELGVRLDSAYRKLGHVVIDYPLMFSIKTRKQRQPWTELDVDFFRKVVGKDILVAEDWITTGNTLKGVLADLARYLPSEVRVSTIKRDPRSLQDEVLDSRWIYSGMIANYKGNKTDTINSDNPIFNNNPN